MRRLLISLLVTTVYGGTATAQTCIKPGDRTAFDVIGLKSSLMVSALTCDEGDQYDSFMTQFQPYILAEQHVIDNYFHRVGGLAGQAQEDDYVTALANTQSAAAAAQGAAFCKTSASLYAVVSALQADTDLDSLAAAKLSEQPISMTSCGGSIDHNSHHSRPPQAITVADSQ